MENEIYFFSFFLKIRSYDNNNNNYQCKERLKLSITDYILLKEKFENFTTPRWIAKSIIRNK